MAGDRVSALFFPEGESVSPDEDLRLIARVEEMKLWAALQPKRIGRLKSAVVFLVLLLLAAIAQAVIGLQSPVFFYSAAGTALLSLIVFSAVHRSAGNIAPDEEVVGVSKIHVPIDVLPLPGGVMLVDGLGVASEQTLAVKTLSEPNVVTTAAKNLGFELEGLNVVEPADRKHEHGGRTYFGVDGMILNLLGTIESNLARFEEIDVTLPVLSTASEVGQWAWKNRQRLAGVAEPQARSVSRDHLQQLRTRLVDMCDKADAGVEVLDEIRGALAKLDKDILVRLETAHARSLDLVQTTADFCGRTAFWPSFNFYAFEDEEKAVAETNMRNILFGKMVYDAKRDTWVCPSQNRDVDMARSLVINRFRDELFYPILDQFRASYHEEIMRIDRDLENRVTQLQHEWQVKARDLEGGLFKTVEQKKAEIRRMASEASALKSKITGLAGTLAEFRRLSSSNREQFLAKSNELAETARQKADLTCAKIDQEFSERKSEAYAEQQAIAEQNKIEDDRRNKEVVSAIGAMSDKLEDQGERMIRASMMTDGEKVRLRKGNTGKDVMGKFVGRATEKEKIKKGAAKAASEA